MEFGEYVGTERQIGEHRVRASVAEAFAYQLEEILYSFEQHSDRLYDGYTMQYGWGPIFVEDLPGEENAGVMTLRVPDYQGDAANERTQDLTMAIYTYAQQMSFARNCGEPAEEVHFWQDMLAAPGWEDFEDFRIQRLDTGVEQFSGWMMIPVDWDFGDMVPKEEVAFVPAWKVAQVHPAATRALMMPTWSGVEMRGGDVTRIVEWGDTDGSERLIFPTDENEGDG